MKGLDPLLLILYGAGALIFYELWVHEVLTASTIWKIISAEI